MNVFFIIVVAVNLVCYGGQKHNVICGNEGCHEICRPYNEAEDYVH